MTRKYPDGQQDVVMPQGFWKRVTEWLRQNNYAHKLHRNTVELAPPRFDLMHGFRFSQRALLESALSLEHSGLIGAPTRYGKTTLIINTLRAFPGITTVVTAPGRDLIKQLYDDISRSCPGREVKMMGGGSRNKYPSDDITVCSMDSLHKVDKTRTELLLIDEPHASVTGERMPEIAGFTKARRIGFGATLDGRFDGRDDLIVGTIGPILANRTYLEAVAEKAICPIHVIFCVLDFEPFWVPDRNRAYSKLLFESDRVAGLLRRMNSEIIPPDWQTLFFIKSEDQANFYSPRITEDEPVPIAMDKVLTSKERIDMTENIRTSRITKALCSDIYVQGVTFSDLRVLVNLSGGGPYTTAIQKPGRLAEIRPDIGKQSGILVDFLFSTTSRDSHAQGRNAWGAVVRDCVARLAKYQQIGYKVHFARNLKELKTAWEKAVQNSP